MQEKSGFKIGDIVVLKSGGPKMTVSKIIEKDSVLYADDIIQETIRTTWFSGAKKASGDFPPEALIFPPEPNQKTK
jgi:uncharacterized protein YodC (DUF2158 family)